MADALWAIGVRCVGPKQNLAQLESSKAFTRNLLIDNAIGACPRYKVATTLAECRAFFELVGPLMYVVKADGLCGGKGVKVGGEHLASDEESLEFCRCARPRRRPPRARGVLGVRDGVGAASRGRLVSRVA